MEKILIAMVCSFLFIPSVFACGFMVYNEYGVPVLHSAYYMPINGTKYPSDQKMILYNFTVYNFDSVSASVTLSPTGDLINYMYENSVSVGPYLTKNVSMYVYVDGPYRAGILYAVGSCSNGVLEGEIPVEIKGRGNEAPVTCRNTVLSCGVYPNCVDLTTLNTCSNGLYRLYSCLNNVPTYSESCTNYCCGLTGGTCKNSLVCQSSSTTTTSSSTTTTTTPTTTTTSTTNPGSSGCFNGNYRNYYYSNGQWQFSESCTNYCCGSIGGTCRNGQCSATSTTTTSSTTTTTTTPTTTTTTSTPTSSGCVNGNYRNYYFSGGIWQFSESCTNYCCGLIGGNCRNGMCSGSTTTTTSTQTTTTTTTTTTPPNCNNGPMSSSCVSGYYRNFYCLNNQWQYDDLCTSYCCGLIGGKCKNNMCNFFS